jgi:signal transduction histidine kinase
VFGRDRANREVFEIASQLAISTIPGSKAPFDQQHNAIVHISRELKTNVSLFDRRFRLITASGDPGPRPSGKSGWHRGRHGPNLQLRLPDGRWLVVDLGGHGMANPVFNLVLFLGTIALGVAVASYPFARRLTRRLERLQTGVEQIGGGDLSTRIEVEGSDEIASLARSFNDSAAKIEKLLESHRLLLANASHELRTPLARIRMGVELLSEKEDPDRREALNRDIAELDELIDEIMLMSRLDAGSHPDLSRHVDLVALAAEECARYDHCSLSGQAPEIPGDASLLRRLVRNLLENANEHGSPPIEVEIRAADRHVVLTVSDRGRGIPEEFSEKVFQPFYRGSDRQNVKGYGLGLPLVRQIAETHGGSVAVLTNPKMHSAIAVTLPLNGKQRA